MGTRALYRYAIVALLTMLGAATAAGDESTLLKAQWQTFESCPRAERPCGPVCMPESFACCDKATAAICPPGKSCCGTSCGCGRCQTCEGNVCVPDEKCRKEEEARGANPGGTTLYSLAPLVGIAIPIAIGTLNDTDSDSRPPISP